MSIDFWENRTLCRELLGCSRYVYPLCIAFQDRSGLCWEHLLTQSEKLLNIPRDCPQ